MALHGERGEKSSTRFGKRFYHQTKGLIIAVAMGASSGARLAPVSFCSEFSYNGDQVVFGQPYL